MADRHIKIKRRTKPEPKRPKRSAKPKTQAAPTASTGQSKSRTKRRWPRIKRLIIRLATVAVVALLLVVIAMNWDNFSPDNIREWFADTFSSNSGDGYTVDIDGRSIVSMPELKNSLAVVTDTSLVMYNKNGGENERWSINYSEPLFRTAGKYALIAELGGVRYSVFSRSKQVLDVTSDNLTDAVHKTEMLDDPSVNRIISADIRDDGTVAVVTEASQSHTSEVRVYTLKGKKIFQLKNSTLMAMDVALSPDRKTVTITGVQTKNGVLQSVVRMYDLSNADLLYEKALDDVMLFSVDYFNNGYVMAVGDTACMTINPDNGKETVTDFGDRELMSMEMSGSGCGLVLKAYGQMDGGELMIIGADGHTQKTVAVEREYRHVAMDGKTAYILTADQLYTVDENGIGPGTAMSQDSRLICAYRHQVMVAGLTQLTACEPK